MERRDPDEFDELRLDDPTGMWPARTDEISATTVAGDTRQPATAGAPEDLEWDPAIELDADGRPRRRGLARKLLTHGLPVALLLGVIAWTLNELGSITTERGGRHSNDGGGGDVIGDTKAPDAGAGGPGATPEDGDEDDDGDEPEAAPLGKNIRKLLKKVDLLRVVPPEGGVTVRLHNEHVLAPRTVTVINLWATFCEPCKKELPALKAMFEAASGRWGGKVRFVPIQVDDPADSIFSYAQFADKMPPTDAFLVDTGVGGGVRPPLVAAGVITEKAGLPITFVLDCRQSVRWHATKELGPADLAALSAKLDELHGELGKRYCKPPIDHSKLTSSASGDEADADTDVEADEATVSHDGPKRASPEKRAAPRPTRDARCHDDGKCDRLLEDCSCEDCPCTAGEQCMARARGGSLCTLGEGELL